MSDRHEHTLDDLDRAILAALPDIGEKIGKYLDATLSVPQIKAKVEPSYGSGTYGGRLRLLAQHGYVVTGRVRGSRGKGWQRTAKGKLAASHDLEEAENG